MSAVIEVELLGVQELFRGFAGIEKFLDNLESVLEPAGKEALGDIRHEFDVGGPGWEPHAGSTGRRKVGPSRLLWDSGALRDSFEQGAAGNIFRSDPKYLEVGSSIFYGPYHQEGRGHNPVRLIINATPDQEAKYGEIGWKVLAEEIRSLGFEVS